MAKKEPHAVYRPERLQSFVDDTYKSASALARACDVSAATAYNWLSGKTEPSASMLIRIWDAGCNPLYLLCLSNVMLSDSEQGMEWRKELGVSPGAVMDVTVRMPIEVRDRIAVKLGKRLDDLEMEIHKTKLLLDGFLKGHE